MAKVREPAWITRELILAVQDQLIARFGGLPGVRDEGLLDSALSRPLHLFAYERTRATYFAMAAAYAAGIVGNHPFLDGNKRTGFMAAYIFLGANGFTFKAAEEEVVHFTRGLAAGVITDEEYTTWLEKSSEQALS